MSGHDFSRAVRVEPIPALAPAVFPLEPLRSKANRAGALWKDRLRRVLSIVLATLREIFDESAYERFLSRTHSTRSVQSYREFLGEREAIIATRPRCC